MDRTISVLVSVLLAAVVLAPSTAHAQMVRGTVIAAGGELRPVEGAIVRLLTADSVHIDMVLTGREGGFAVAAPRAGRYILQVEHVAFEIARTDPFVVPGSGSVTRQVTIEPRAPLPEP
jgi:hypothetical protein